MNIATALKSEICRVARKEVRAEVTALKTASSRYRSDIAELKRRIVQLERLVGQLNTGSRKKLAAVPEEDQPATVARYSARNLAALRRRLGLSAADLGRLLGVSGASIYLWEQGDIRPRSRNMPAIARVRAMTKKTALAHLAMLK